RPHGFVVDSAWCADARPRSGRRVAARTHRSLAHRPQPYAGPWASPVFCGDVLQGAVIQRQVSHHLLELAVLFLELAPPSQLADLQAAILRLPAIVGPSTDAELSADVRDGLSRLHPL